MPDWLTWAFPAASLSVSVLAPWIATARARAHFEGVMGANFKSINDRLDAQDKSVEKQFQTCNANVKEALDKLYSHEREIGGIVAAMNAQRGYSAR